MLLQSCIAQTNSDQKQWYNLENETYILKISIESGNKAKTSDDQNFHKI